ncbi:MAG TPA: hypothetical protein DCS66_01625, partial [Flavobacteriaceae bacterium]|nr:hypothetical protein [Flavobacteriaceae bacterium]
GAGDDAWERSLDDDAFYGCWKIVSLQPESVLVTLECTNIEAADTTKLTNVQFAEGTELMGNVFTKVECQSGLFILYMDCLNS